MGGGGGRRGVGVGGRGGDWIIDSIFLINGRLECKEVNLIAGDRLCRVARMGRRRALASPPPPISPGHPQPRPADSQFKGLDRIHRWDSTVPECGEVVGVGGGEGIVGGGR